MKKLTCLVTIITAFAFVLCLVGCSSENNDSSNDSSGSNTLNLDKTVTIHGITFNVSSDWLEDEYDFSNDTTILGFTSYTSDSSALYVSVSYSNTDLDTTAKNAFDDRIESWITSEDTDYENIEYSEVSSTEISGAKCTIYEYSYDWKSDNVDSYSSGNGCFAYIMAPNVHYEIQSTGSDSVSTVEAILDTVSIES